MKKILIIDEEQFILDTIAKVLKKEGYAVMSAQNVPQAQKILREENPDLVIEDVTSFQNADQDIITEIKKRKIPAIFVTGIGKEYTFRTASTNTYLAKPFTSQKLVETVRKYICWIFAPLVNYYL